MSNVVITGIGLVTPLGLGREKTWNQVLSSKTAVRHDSEFEGVFSCRVRDLDVPPEVRLVSMSFLAAAEAVKDSSLDSSSLARAACTLSVSKPNLASTMRNRIQFPEIYMPSATGRQLQRILKLGGPVINICSGCATGAESVILGARMIEAGECDIVIAGAAESSLYPLYIAGFSQMGVLSAGKVAPFSRNRDGFAIGEGAGVLVLERKEKALFRTAQIYGEISGWDMSNDLGGIVSFDLSGKTVASSIKRALKRVKLDTVDYINAHGTGTRYNDLVETRAIKEALGENASKVSISSTKAATGHLLGASGAVELAFSLLALRDHVIPPTLNLLDHDPECTLDYTPLVARHKVINTAMSLSFGFGGQIAAVVIQK